MKYNFTLDAQDYELLEHVVVTAMIKMQQEVHGLQRAVGRANKQTFLAEATLESLERCQRALKSGRDTATPESAVPNPGVTHQRAIDSDEHPFVAGRPRNDPRNPKQKR